MLRVSSAGAQAATGENEWAAEESKAAQHSLHSSANHIPEPISPSATCSSLRVTSGSSILSTTTGAAAKVPDGKIVNCLHHTSNEECSAEASETPYSTAPNSYISQPVPVAAPEHHNRSDTSVACTAPENAMDASTSIHASCATDSSTTASTGCHDNVPPGHCGAIRQHVQSTACLAPEPTASRTVATACTEATCVQSVSATKAEKPTNTIKGQCKRDRPAAKGLPGLCIVSISTPEETAPVAPGVIVVDKSSLRKSQLADSSRLQVARMQLCDTLLQVGTPQVTVCW